MLLLDGLAIGLLGIIAWQDYKYRAVNWVALAGLLVIGGLNLFLSPAYRQVFQGVGFNMFFLALQLLILTVYFSLRERRWVNITNRYFGWGDILFLAAAATFFSPVNFLLYYMLGLMLVLLASIGYKMVIDYGLQKIPLAGGLALVLIGLMGSRWLPGIKWNFYDDQWWMLQFEYLL